jgi:hypothetical protein
MQRAGEQAREIQETLGVVRNILQNRVWGPYPHATVVHVMNQMPPVAQEMQRALLALDMARQLQEELVALRAILAAGITGAEALPWGDIDEEHPTSRELGLGATHYSFRWQQARRQREVEPPGDEQALMQQRASPTKRPAPTEFDVSVRVARLARSLEDEIKMMSPRHALRAAWWVGRFTYYLERRGRCLQVARQPPPFTLAEWQVAAHKARQRGAPRPMPLESQEEEATVQAWITSVVDEVQDILGRHMTRRILVLPSGVPIRQWVQEETRPWERLEALEDGMQGMEDVVNHEEGALSSSSVALNPRETLNDTGREAPAATQREKGADDDDKVEDLELPTAERPVRENLNATPTREETSEGFSCLGLILQDLRG